MERISVFFQDLVGLLKHHGFQQVPLLLPSEFPRETKPFSPSNPCGQEITRAIPADNDHFR
jgi:hypothetical protein